VKLWSLSSSDQTGLVTTGMVVLSQPSLGRWPRPRPVLVAMSLSPWRVTAIFRGKFPTTHRSAVSCNTRGYAIISNTVMGFYHRRGRRMSRRGSSIFWERQSATVVSRCDSSSQAGQKRTSKTFSDHSSPRLSALTLRALTDGMKTSGHILGTNLPASAERFIRMARRTCY